MKIAVVLHPFGEKMPGGLPRIISGWTEALLSVDEKNEYTVFVKERPKTPPVLPGKNWRLEILGPGRFWLDRLRKFPLADVYLFNTPVLPFFWKPPHAVVIALDYPYKYLPAKGLRTVLFRKFIGWYHGRSLRRADHVVAVSQSTKNDTMRFFGIPSEKISVVYHGYKKICELPESPVSLPARFFFFAGTMKERKNVLHIIKAFELFLASHPDAKEDLVLGGKNEGAYYDMLVDYLGKSPYSGRIIFTGHLNENQLSFAYRRATALVFPSVVEGTGFPILEAMSCGVPVITSNIFGPAELGGNGAALLIDPRRPEETAAAMGRIVSDETVRRDLAANARKQLSLFSWERTGRETLAILERAAAGGRSHLPRVVFLAHNVRPHNGGGVLARNIIKGMAASLPSTVRVVTAQAGGEMGEEPLFAPRWFLSMPRLWKMIRAVRQADIVHAFDVFPYGVIGVLCARGSRAKVVITANGTGSIRHLYLFGRGMLCRFALQHAAKVIAISRFTRDEILKKVPGLSIDVINPGIDLAIFGAPPEPRFAARVKKYQPYIMSVGSLRLRKGYKWSIPAFKKVLATFPDLRYLIVGKKYTDKEYARLRTLIDDLGLADKVFLIEDITSDEELAAFYHGARLFCLKSFNIGHDVEGFGIVFLEAAAAGIPVVGTKDCGADDAVADGRNGLLVAWNDVDGFAAAIVSILSDARRYQEMSAASRSFVERFTWEKKVAEYERVYRKLL